MGARIHPSESLAAFYPWLAKEWHPTQNALRPDQITRSSGRDAVWRCADGHEWTAVIYSRTVSSSGCPECFRLQASDKIKAGQKLARQRREAEAAAQLATAILLEELGGEQPF